MENDLFAGFLCGLLLRDMLLLGTDLGARMLPDVFVLLGRALPLDEDLVAVDWKS